MWYHSKIFHHRKFSRGYIIHKWYVLLNPKLELNWIINLLNRWHFELAFYSLLISFFFSLVLNFSLRLSLNDLSRSVYKKNKTKKKCCHLEGNVTFLRYHVFCKCLTFWMTLSKVAIACSALRHVWSSKNWNILWLKICIEIKMPVACPLLWGK